MIEAARGRRPAIVLRAGVLALLLVAAPAAGAGPDSGPLRLADTFLLGTGFLTLEPESAAIVAEGAWRVDLVLSGNNTWSQSVAVDHVLKRRGQRAPLSLEELRTLEPTKYDGDGIFFTDGEVRRAALTVRRGVAEGVELVMGVTVLDFGGGFTDGMIQGFHDTFSLSQDGRGGVPLDVFTIYLRDGDGHELFRDVAPGLGLGDVKLAVKTALPVRGRTWRTAAAAHLKLPVGADGGLYSSGSTDVGLQLLAGRRIGRTVLHLAVGAAHLGAAERLGTDAQTQVFASVAAERPLGRGFAGLLQLRGRQSPFRSLGLAQLAEHAYVVDLGVRVPVHGDTDLWLALSENFVNFGSSADAAIHLGFSRPF